MNNHSGNIEEPKIKLGNWKIDEAHSKLQFSAKHMIISEVVGEFKKFKFNIKGSEEFSDSEIYAEIDVNSINTGNTDRDNHLKSADFFDVEKYPTIMFKSKLIEKMDDENYTVKGDLTIKDVTKELELNVIYGGKIVDPYGNLRAGYKVKGSLNRFDYNLKWNAFLEAGGAVVGKTIGINCDVEVIKEK